MIMLEKIIFYLKMGMRNVIKYKRKSIQVILIISIGAFVITAIGAFTVSYEEKFLKDMLENTAHGKIYYKGYYKKQEISPLGLSIPNYKNIIKNIISKDSSVEITPSISAGAVVSKGDKSLNMLCTGIQPYSDRENKNVFTSYRVYKNAVLDGRFFLNNNDTGIIISSYTALNLGCRLNDRIILFTADSYGSFNAVELKIIGIFQTGYIDKDENICIADLKSIQKLVGLEGRATEISLFFDDIKKAGTFKESYREIIKDNNLEFYSWKDLLGGMLSIIEFGKIFQLIIYLIFIVIASVGITNTVLISIFDRIRDIGTLRAIGYTKHDIDAIILSETFVLGIIGSATGTLIGGILIYYLSVAGIPISNESKELAGSMFSSNRIYPVFKLQYMVYPFVISTIVPLLSAIYPLTILRKMKIRELLGYV